ncbi:MAG: carboxymuconolactone decarboxylase family protein, partial [Phycisphaerales bacterium]|nr:carboxymuconolactone decarboxylase family protein [Phycisphaerales bacterium]MCA9306073.1 carboxymuconolactone decarboxylase family protein [Phycisphaerales bacterium]
MSHTTPHEFRMQRTMGQERLMSVDHQGVKRFLNLDSAAYRDTSPEGGLDAPTKELLGLTASCVLRCDDCIRYHVEQCVNERVPDQHIIEAMNIALVVGGSIFIPHFRRALLFLDALRAEKP